MDLMLMRPAMLKEALRAQWPVLIPFGALEYHGAHLPLGTDTLLAEGFCRRIAGKTNAVLAPAIPYAPTMHWAGGDADGDIDFPSEALLPYVQAVLDGLLRMGFRRLYVLVGHQGCEGIPATIARLATHRIQQRMAGQLVPGWGRQDDPAHSTFFDMIRICAYDQFVDYSAVQGEKPMPIGHAGRGETQLIDALYDGLVDWDAEQPQPLPPWLADLSEADRANGEYWVNLCVDAWVRHLTGATP